MQLKRCFNSLNHVADCQQARPHAGGNSKPLKFVKFDFILVYQQTNEFRVFFSIVLNYFCFDIVANQKVDNNVKYM